MYYCTIYQQSSGKQSDKSLFELFISLSYLDKADAENYKQSLITQALENGGSIYLEDGAYTTVTGKIILRTTGIDINRTNNRYKIGIESDATQFSVLTLKSKASVPIYKTTDGLHWDSGTTQMYMQKAFDTAGM